MKAFGVERIAVGERRLVVDLEACTGMDSTFMGTLAGLATRLSSQNGVLQIADAGSRNRNSLQDLGLDFLIEIDPKESVWRGEVATIRNQLQSSGTVGHPSNIQRAIHVLEAHQVLSKANEKNLHTFSTVVTLLESELEEKKKSPEKPGGD